MNTRYAPIDLSDKLALLSQHWSPRVVAEMNDYQFKLVKLQGAFVWHRHADTDEVFIVLDGNMTIEFRDGVVALSAGQMHVVPKGGRTPPGGGARMQRAAGRAARCGQYRRCGWRIHRRQRRLDLSVVQRVLVHGGRSGAWLRSPCRVHAMMRCSATSTTARGKTAALQ
nr:cupin domain-containing protein [Xanthomonas citri]